MQTDEVFHLPRTTVFVFPFNFFSDDPLGPLTPSPWALWQLKEPQLHMVPHYYMRWLSVNPKNRLEPGGRKLKRSKSFWFHECAGWPSAHTHTHTLRAAWQDGTNVAAEDAILLGKATACGAGRDVAAATDVAKANAKWLSAAAAAVLPTKWERGKVYESNCRYYCEPSDSPLLSPAISIHSPVLLSLSGLIFNSVWQRLQLFSSILKRNKQSALLRFCLQINLYNCSVNSHNSQYTHTHTHTGQQKQ